MDVICGSEWSNDVSVAVLILRSIILSLVEDYEITFHRRVNYVTFIYVINRYMHFTCDILPLSVQLQDSKS
jgi:hypothetical protein